MEKARVEIEDAPWEKAAFTACQEPRLGGRAKDSISLTTCQPRIQP